MPSMSDLRNGFGIFAEVAKLLDTSFARDAAKYGAKVLKGYKDVSETGGSITNVSAQTNIISRVFVDESVIGEAVLPNLMKSIHEWYAAQIITALQLNQFITSKITVKDMTSVIQTGQNSNALSSIIDRLEKHGTESFGRSFSEEALEDRVYNKPEQLSVKEGNRLASELDKLQKENDEYKKGFKDANVNVRSVSVSDNKIGPMGELYEATMTNPNNPTASIKIPIFVQMQPTIVPASVAPRFIDMNVSPSAWQRWTQMRAGELSFWTAFVSYADLHSKLKSSLKDPKAAQVFEDFLKTNAKKDAYALGDLRKSIKSSNLANSVVVFSESTVTQAKADSGIDLHKKQDRQRYFRDAYAMIIVIVDELHQRVTIYFNGIEGVLNCAYSDFKPKDSKFDPKDFITAMTAFSSGSLGRLR